jgi:TolB-like protein
VVLPGLVSNSVAGVWSEACAEAITDGLAESGRLRVIRSPRANAFAAAEVSPEEVGRQLNVRCAVVCTAVLRDHFIDLRVEAIDVFSESVLASETLLGSTDTVLMLQDEATHLLAEHFGIEDHSVRRSRRRGDPSSYLLRLQARALTRRGAHGEAIAAYGDAIAAAPDNVTTLVEFARLVVGLPGRFVNPSASIAARDAVDRALRIAPECAEAHTASALLHCRFDGDWSHADRELLHAVHRDPTFVDAHFWRGMLLVALRRFDEAESALDAAATMSDSRSVESLGPAILLLHEGRFSEAAARFQSAERSPWLIRALVLAGRVGEAAQLVSSDDVASTGIVAAFSRQTAAALAAAEKIENDPYDAAVIFTTLGDAGRALTELHRAREMRSASMMFAGVDPFLHPLRQTREFRDLLTDLGLP